MRSLVAIFLIATVFAFAILRSPQKKLLLMASAIPLAILGNFVRLFAIVIAASIGGEQWGDYVHEGGPLGIISLLPYIPAIFGLLWLGRLLEKSAHER
jgi:exosortase/archaeosortase family protein